MQYPVRYHSVGTNREFKTDYSSLLSLLTFCMEDHSRPSWLAVHWAGSTPRIGHGSIAWVRRILPHLAQINNPLSSYAHISLVDLHTLKSTWGDNRPFQLMTCSIAADGEVTPIWTKDDTSSRSISAYPTPFLFARPDFGFENSHFSRLLARQTSTSSQIRRHIPLNIAKRKLLYEIPFVGRVWELILRFSEISLPAHQLE